MTAKRLLSLLLLLLLLLAASAAHAVDKIVSTLGFTMYYEGNPESTEIAITVDDLYGLVKDHPEYCSNDGVHFNGKGVAVQAEQVTKRILESLK